MSSQRKVSCSLRVIDCLYETTFLCRPWKCACDDEDKKTLDPGLHSSVFGYIEPRSTHGRSRTWCCRQRHHEAMVDFSGVFSRTQYRQLCQWCAAIG